MDKPHGEAVIELAAESPHQHFEDVGKGVVVVVPDVRGNGGALDDLPGMPQQKLEEREFLGSQRDRSAGAASAPSCRASSRRARGGVRLWAPPAASPRARSSPAASAVSRSPGVVNPPCRK